MRMISREAVVPQNLARTSMAFVLAGGRGSRLMELTDRRAKPAVFFGGTSRIIDFALSNALNSGIRRICVATQYKAHSLIRHLQRGWNFFRAERNEGFDILPASQRVAEDKWYVGTADAVTQNIDFIEGYAPEFIVVLAGDHVYKMDYERMLTQHAASGADVTVGCVEVPRREATAFGVVDQIVVFGESHLRRILKAYVAYYNAVRTHQSLNKDAPIHRPIQRIEPINSVAVLGGLHHQYCRT